MGAEEELTTEKGSPNLPSVHHVSGSTDANRKKKTFLEAVDSTGLRSRVCFPLSLPSGSLLASPPGPLSHLSQGYQNSSREVEKFSFEHAVKNYQSV